MRTEKSFKQGYLMIHRQTLSNFRKNVLQPVRRVAIRIFRVTRPNNWTSLLITTEKQGQFIWDIGMEGLNLKVSNWTLLSENEWNVGGRGRPLAYLQQGCGTNYPLTYKKRWKTVASFREAFHRHFLISYDEVEHFSSNAI